MRRLLRLCGKHRPLVVELRPLSGTTRRHCSPTTSTPSRTLSHYGMQARNYAPPTPGHQRTMAHPGLNT
eukprot:9478746-Prorocentrum_lima.AAC.1